MVCHLFYTERHLNRLTVINPSNFLGFTSVPVPWPCRLATVNYLYISINNLIKVLIFQLLYLSLQQESPLKK